MNRMFSIGMPRSKILEEDKVRLVRVFNDGGDYLELANALGIKRGTAWAIVNRALVRNGVVSLPRGGRRRFKIDDAIRECLADIVEEHPTYTLSQLKAELEARLPAKPVVSTSTIAHSLEAQLIVLKKMEDAPQERNSEVTKLLRKEYAEWLLNSGLQQELIFIDEAVINLWTRRTRGRAPRGQRAVRVINGRRGANFTVVFAISVNRGLLKHDLFQGGMTADRFVQFVEAVSEENAHVHPGVVLFDNASCHRRVFQAAQLENGHTLKSLPPYSPFLNPVEQAFSAFKAHLKRELEETCPHMITMNHDDRMATLAQLGEQAVAAITPDACRNWFLHTQRKITACFQQEDILM